MSASLNDKFARLAALSPARKRDTLGARAKADLPAEFDPLAQLLGAVAKRNRYGEHLEVHQWYSAPEACLPTAHALRLLLPSVSGQTANAHERLSDPAEWLFLDTETTGLAGGTGTYAFLVGLAWWEAGGLQVEQFFMRDHGEEHSLLLELSRRLAERRVLVTFNGKSFDWPLLETRFLMTRAITPRPPVAHIDLLHPARQLWRLRLGSVRLTELERHVLGADRLGWDRRRDIDSALIPQIYFDYLRGGPPDMLLPVFHHNRMDLRGLAALAGKILDLLAEPEAADGPAEDALELYGLSRLLRRRGEAARARLLYERALRAGLPGAVDRAARRELALLAKRERDFGRATSLWEDLITHSADCFDAYEQLAIYYEHHAREHSRAAELTREALAQLQRTLQACSERGRGTGRIEPGRYRRLQARLEYRLARLTRKSRGPLLEPNFPEARGEARESN